MKMNKMERGQGLIETMAVLLVIGFTVIALLRFESYLAYTNLVTQEQNEASILASSKLDELRFFIKLTGPEESYDSIVDGEKIEPGTTTTYTIRWEVKSYLNPTYKQINVTVTWTDLHQKTQSIMLSTNIASVDPKNSLETVT